MSVALELQRQGHDVAAVVHPSYAKSAAKLPLAVHIAGNEYPENYLLAHPELLHPRNAFYEITRQLLLPDAALQFRELERLHAARKIDAVVAHHIAFGAIWWAESRGVPLTIGWLAPIATLTPDGHGSMVPGIARRTPKPIGRALRWLIPFLIRRELDAPMNALRASLGLTAERNSMLRLAASRHGHIGLWDEAFRSPADGDPPGLVTCGFPLLETGDAPLAPEIAEFLAADPAPIVAALGTTGGAIPLPVADLVAAGCELAGRRALLIGDRPPSAARTSRWVAFAPHAPLFAKTPLVVHHGGIGTLAAVLRAGKPSLVLPLADDQFDTAVRLRGRGVAAVLDVRRATPAAVARAIGRLLDDPAAAAAAVRLGERVRASNGAKCAADAVVAHAKASARTSAF